MSQKKKEGRGPLAVLLAAIVLGGMFCGDSAMMVRADQMGAFSIEAELLPSDNETYDVRLTVENNGGDWEGTVRLMADEDYRKPSAYDTALSLPQGSRKQFVARIPVSSIDSTNGTIIVTLLDSRDEVTAQKEFTRFLAGQLESLSMGILSDAYPDLTYLDMGGMEIYFYNDFYPIRLVELQQGSLADELDGLTFLVIDEYNTGILTDEELAAIERWNQDGGVLVIGTGAYAEDTLRGFGGGYLGVAAAQLHAPKDMSEAGTSDYNAGGDWPQLTMAQLEGVDSADSSYQTLGYAESMGDGSVCVLPYSLTELGEMGDYWNSQQEYFVQEFLENACDYANARYSYSSSYNDYKSYIRRMLGVMGNSNSILNFGVLKGIVIVYVIFVGPVLYLILRLLKRRELYWIAVPVTALLGIGLIFFAGRDFEVVSTKVYSVAVKELSGSQNGRTYLYCYDAGRKEWDLRMAEGFAYVGPLSNTSYYSGREDESYYYHIKKEGEVYSLGIKPGTNFEDSYFYLNGTVDGHVVEGSLLGENLTVDWNGVSGTIVNNTNQDMDYFAVICNESLYVFENLPAGETRRLKAGDTLFDMTDYYYGSYVYEFLQKIYGDGDYEKVSALSALGVGIFDSIPQADKDQVIIMGVVENWDEAVNDDCSEMSYGCFYSIQ